MGVFRFKEFTVAHDRSTMKVGTDGVLLGAAVKSHYENNILDVGTGCGVIALMLAQRFQAEITAIDLDKDSIEEAASNFEKSPWSERLYPVHETMQEYSQKRSGYYDMIVSNPPFFQNSLKTPGENRNKARHNDTLPFDEFIESSSRLLKPDGGLWVILPVNESQIILEEAQQNGFFPEYQMQIHPKPAREANRRILKLIRRQNQQRRNAESLTIRREDATFTDEYCKLTADFYLQF